MSTCAARRCRGCTECGNPITRAEAIDSMYTRAVFLGLDDPRDFIGIVLDRFNALGGSWSDISTMDAERVRKLLA